MLSPTSHRPRRCCFNTSSKPVAIKYRINGALNRRLRPAHAFLRREILQAVFFLGDDLPDGRTVVNSVLSAYGYVAADLRARHVHTFRLHHSPLYYQSLKGSKHRRAAIRGQQARFMRPSTLHAIGCNL